MYFNIDDIQYMFAWAALIPIIAAIGGPLMDKLFGNSGSSEQEVVQQQQEASRFDVMTPFGQSRWQGDNQIKELSPQMQDMMDRQFDYRNSALGNALDWFGGPPAGSRSSDFSSGPSGGAGEDIQNPEYEGDFQSTREWADWEDMVNYGESRGWGDDPMIWGKEGNPGIPWWQVEEGKFDFANPNRGTSRSQQIAGGNTYENLLIP